MIIEKYEMNLVDVVVLSVVAVIFIGAVKVLMLLQISINVTETS